MEGYKGFYFFCVVLMVTVGLQGSEAADENASCECSVFPGNTSQTTKDTPLLTKSSQVTFECNDAGKKTCSTSCRELATSTKEEGIKSLCEKIGDTEKPMVAALYFKACGATDWTRIETDKTVSLCCKSKAAVPCA